MHAYSTLNGATVFSVLITIGLFVWAAVIHDGVACVAIAAISASTSIACLSNQWRPQVAERPSTAKVPDGDLIIKTRGAAMIVVHCSEEITRELYMGAEKCDYVVPRRVWSVLVGTSTMLLMIAVVLLGNCNWTMQAAVGVAYIILNGVYWALPLLSEERWLWNLEDRYDIEQIKTHKVDVQTPQGTKKMNKALANDIHDNRPCYTRTLAYAIQATGQTKWVARAKFAPPTEAWENWIELARANLGNDHWNAVQAKDDCMAAGKLKDDAENQALAQQAQQARARAQAQQPQYMAPRAQTMPANARTPQHGHL